jgi:hypothetical protein
MSGTTFIPANLVQLIKSDQTVTTAYATAPPGTSIQSVAEHLYGKQHHQHHSLAADEAKEHETGDKSTGGATSLLEKLHLKKTDVGDAHSHGTIDAQHVHKDKDVENPAADQYRAMRLLSAEELQEVKGYGRWGGSKPSDLFLNVSPYHL